MIEDILYDSLFLVCELPNETTGGNISGMSYDGNNFVFTEGSVGSVETITIFVA